MNKKKIMCAALISCYGIKLLRVEIKKKLIME